VDLFAGASDIEELTSLLCGPKCNGIHDAIYDIFSSRPTTLLHGDMRADNVFRTIAADAAEADNAHITFIDWQVIHAGPPAAEFTQAWMHSLEPEVRREDRTMLTEYHAHVVALNPAAAAYTYEMLLDDYTLAFCFWWTALITIGVGTVPAFERPAGASMRQLWTRGLQRAFVAMRDLDCLSRIEELATNVPPDH
jgi:aminoglycoside phosphotransferase (APT) family kinase protein